MITINQLYEKNEDDSCSVIIHGYAVKITRRLSKEDHCSFVNSIVSYLMDNYRKSECLPFRMLLRLATICYYTDLSFDEDVLSDDILKLIYEEELFEKIVGADGEPALINMTQYNDMLEDVSDTLKQRWEMENSARMARLMGQPKEQGTE